MEVYKVRKLNREKDIVVEVPGSKSITNRALLLAALSKGKVTLRGALFSDDSRYFLSSLESLGFKVSADEGSHTVYVEGNGGSIPKTKGEIYVGSAGTAARFLTAMLALSEGEYIINASEQMKKRPMKPLLTALESLGAEFLYHGEEYHLPVTVRGVGYGAKNADESVCDNMAEITLDTNESTQYLSAMLMTGVMNRNGIKIKVTGERKTGSYVDITRKMMGEFGCSLSYGNDTYIIGADEEYDRDNFTYMIEPDVSAACYFYGIGAIMGIRALVKNVFFNSVQGDISFVRALEQMGAKVQEEEEGISVTGPGRTSGLKGIEIDMKTFSDQALTMAAVSIFAEGDTVIKNIGHIRLQESDRLSVMASELGRMGIKCDEKADGIIIHPGRPKPCRIETYDDHRVAMAFTLPGLAEGGIEINNPMCCKKTFENYFELIEGLYIQQD